MVSVGSAGWLVARAFPECACVSFFNVVVVYIHSFGQYSKSFEDDTLSCESATASCGDDADLCRDDPCYTRKLQTPGIAEEHKRQEIPTIIPIGPTDKGHRPSTKHYRKDSPGDA